MDNRIGFVGLGVMGMPMAGHLAEAGYALTALDLDPGRIDALRERQPSVSAAATPAELAAQSDIVITMLPDGRHVREVACGESGLASGFSGGELVIDTSSSEPWLTLETAATLAERGVAVVDAPTSGAEWGAIAAELIFMAGGGATDLDRARPLLECMGRQIFHLGPTGSGHTMKSINNTITAMTFLATAEGLALGTKLGLDPDVMTDVLNVATGMSWITQTHIKQRITSRSFNDPFKLELMVKDVRIALELADQAGLGIPFSRAGREAYLEADRTAGRGASVSELVRWVEKEAGVEIRRPE